MASHSEPLCCSGPRIQFNHPATPLLRVAHGKPGIPVRIKIEGVTSSAEFCRKVPSRVFITFGVEFDNRAIGCRPYILLLVAHEIVESLFWRTPNFHISGLGVQSTNSDVSVSATYLPAPATCFKPDNSLRVDTRRGSASKFCRYRPFCKDHPSSLSRRSYHIVFRKRLLEARRECLVRV